MFDYPQAPPAYDTLTNMDPDYDDNMIHDDHEYVYYDCNDCNGTHYKWWILGFFICTLIITFTAYTSIEYSSFHQNYQFNKCLIPTNCKITQSSPVHIGSSEYWNIFVSVYYHTDIEYVQSNNQLIFQHIHGNYVHSYISKLKIGSNITCYYPKKECNLHSNINQPVFFNKKDTSGFTFIVGTLSAAMFIVIAITVVIYCAKI